MAGKYQFEQMLTPQQVAELFTVDPKTVSRWAREGLIRAVRTPGGHRRFPISAVNKKLQEGIGESAGGGDEDGEGGGACAL